MVSDSEEKVEDEDEEQEEDGEEETYGLGSEGLEEMVTPTSRPSKDIPGSSTSSILPPLS